MIGVIAIIAIVVIVILVLVRCRRAEEEEDEGVSEDHEFTEETVTKAARGTPITGGEWSQPTEDNPVLFEHWLQ